LKNVRETEMAKKQTTRARKQDRARIAGGQDHEVQNEGKKTRKSASAVRKVGDSRKRVEVPWAARKNKYILPDR